MLIQIKAKEIKMITNKETFFVVDKCGFSDSEENARKLAAIADYFVDNGAHPGEGVREECGGLPADHKHNYEDYYEVSTCHYFGVRGENTETYHSLARDRFEFLNADFVMNLDEAYEYITRNSESVQVGDTVKTSQGKGTIIAEGVDHDDEVWVVQMKNHLKMFPKFCHIEPWTEFDEICARLREDAVTVSPLLWHDLYEKGYLKLPE